MVVIKGINEYLDSAPRILGNRIVRGGLVPAHMRPDNNRVSVSATLAPYALGQKLLTGVS